MNCVSLIVDEDACIAFLTKYAKAGCGQMVNSILKFAQSTDDQVFNCIGWIEWMNDNLIDFGGELYEMNKNSITAKPYYIYIYDFGHLQKSWFEIYQFIINIERKMGRL